MGILGLWPFLKRKGYEAALFHQHPALLNTLEPGRKLLIDVQGCIFSTIRYAYSSCATDDEAHVVVERKLEEFATSSNSVLYLDGSPAEEKMLTHKHREETRSKALSAADASTAVLMDRVNGNLRVRKQHFLTISKLLRKAFYWSPEARRALAQHLRTKGWTVIECSTEADIKIACDCESGDVVISGDSDMLIHKNVRTIWRPISRRRFLVYEIPEVLAALGINRDQLTVLGLVSHNDYNRNIYGLGCAANFRIIKELDGGGMFSHIDQMHAILRSLLCRSPSHMC